MKINIFFVQFSTLLFLLTSAFNNNLKHENLLLSDKGLSNYVCEVTRNILKSKNDIQDILIKNLGYQIWSSEVNDIAGCVTDVGAVVVSDFDNVMTVKALRKATVVILMLKIVAAVSKVI